MPEIERGQVYLCFQALPPPAKTLEKYMKAQMQMQSNT